MKPSISIIIPIYNAQKSIGNTIESIVNQTYKEFELILVNDGSTDNSLEICKLYSKKYPQIKIINKKNEGVLLARKTGVYKSTGEWIMFVDADDTIKINTLETLLPYTNTYDLICFDSLYTKAGKIIKRQNNSIYSNQKIDIHRSLLNFKLSGSSWGKLYNKKLFENDFEWPDYTIKIGEDILTTLNIIRICKDIKIINKELYIYEQNETSVMHTKSQIALTSMFRYINMIKQFYSYNNYDCIRNDINTFIIKEYYAYIRYGGKWDDKFITQFKSHNKLPYKIYILLKAFSLSPHIGKSINNFMNIMSHIKFW